MSSVFRRVLVIGAGAALLVGLTAGPLSASATGKIYSASVSSSPSPLLYSTPTTSGSFSVTFTNQTPGNSQFNSVAMTAPTGYTISSSASQITASASSGNLGNVSYNVSGGTLQVTNLYPVGYGQWVKFTFSATVNTAGLSCTNNVGTWTTQAWTGSNLSGAQFALTGAAPTTTIGTVLQPAGQPGATITVNGVTVTNNDPANCAFIGLSRSVNSVTVLKPSDTKVNLTVDVQWNAEAAPVPPATLPVTQVSAIPPATGFQNIQWCGSTAGTPTMPSGQISCLVSESTTIYGTNQVQVHDVIYLLGDWSAQRTS